MAEKVSMEYIRRAENRAKRILRGYGFQGRRVFSDGEIGRIVNAASVDALEDLALDAPAFDVGDIGYIANCYGSEIIEQIFRDYRTARDSKTETFPLLWRANRARDAERYPVVLTDMSSNSPDVMAA